MFDLNKVKFVSYEYFCRLKNLQEEVSHSNVTTTVFKQKQLHSSAIGCELLKQLVIPFLVLFIVFLMVVVVVLISKFRKTSRGK